MSGYLTGPPGYIGWQNLESIPGHLNVYRFGLGPGKVGFGSPLFRQVILVTGWLGLWLGPTSLVLGFCTLQPPLYSLYRVARVLPHFSQGDYRDL